MKIGILVDQILPGGVQLAAIEQVKLLNKRGHDAKLLILMRKNYPVDYSPIVQYVPHQYLSDSYPFFLRKTIKFPFFSFLSSLHLVSPLLAPRVIKHDAYDIIASWGTTTCLTAQAIRRALGIPYIAIIHDPIVYILDKVYKETSLRYFFPILKTLGKHVERSILTDAKDVVIISNVHFKYLKKKYCIDAKILPLGVEAQQNFLKKRGQYLLSFGRWQKEKNPLFLLKLMRELPNQKLIIAGTWIKKEDLSWFEKKIKEEHVESQVEVIPHYSPEILKELCQEALLFLHPHFESFGLAALEAASMNLPIIIPQKSGVTEKLIHGVHGFFPKHVRIAEYKPYIQKLLENKDLALRMGQSAASVVKKEFSWESHVVHLLKIMTSSLKPKPSPHILVLETGHTPGISLAGGDKLMEPMAMRLPRNYQFSIITSYIGTKHWQKAPLKKKMIVLPKNTFDASTEPLWVFFTYCIRMFTTTKMIKRQKDVNIIYSSTNILPDVLPAYAGKRHNPHLSWIARIHHLIPKPHKREGRFIVNTVSFLMQMIALSMIKRGADLIIALNEDLKKDLIRKGFPPHRLRVLGAGIDFDKINTLNVSANTTSYDGVFLGRLHLTKGIFDLIPIWKQVVETCPYVKLAVIGGGQEHMKSLLQRQINQAGLSKHIFLLGYRPDKQVYSIMKKATVFLFTDHEAGWGLAVAEAMACGLPVVGWDIGILGNIYRKGYVKIPLNNNKLFSRQVIKIVNHKALRKGLSQEAISEAKKLDWRQTSNKFLAILKSV